MPHPIIATAALQVAEIDLDFLDIGQRLEGLSVDADNVVTDEVDLLQALEALERSRYQCNLVVSQVQVHQLLTTFKVPASDFYVNFKLLIFISLPWSNCCDVIVPCRNR